MLTDKPCECEVRHRCGGFISSAEARMSEMRPRFTPQDYHEFMILFEMAFDSVEEEYARTKQAGADQARL